MIIDGAHNEDAAKKLRTSIERYFRKGTSAKEIVLIMGVFKDKEYEKIVRILCPLAKRVYTVDLPNKERTLPGSVLAKCIQKIYLEQPDVIPADSIQDAVASAYTYASADAKNRVVIACGSLSYLSEVGKCVKRIIERKDNDRS